MSLGPSPPLLSEPGEGKNLPRGHGSMSLGIGPFLLLLEGGWT